MTDLEKVILGMECCLANGHNNCPYKSTDEGIDKVTTCTTYLMQDALSLLKEQEPRVMPLEEVREMSWDYCYLEEEIIEVIKDKALQIYSGKHRISCITWPIIASCTLLFGDEAYGKKWRCWTARPTEEQRKATPWEPPKEEAI